MFRVIYGYCELLSCDWCLRDWAMGVLPTTKRGISKRKGHAIFGDTGADAMR